MYSSIFFLPFRRKKMSELFFQSSVQGRTGFCNAFTRCLPRAELPRLPRPAPLPWRAGRAPRPGTRRGCGGAGRAPSLLGTRDTAFTALLGDSHPQHKPRALQGSHLSRIWDKVPWNSSNYHARSHSFILFWAWGCSRDSTSLLTSSEIHAEMWSLSLKWFKVLACLLTAPVRQNGSFTQEFCSLVHRAGGQSLEVTTNTRTSYQQAQLVENIHPTSPVILLSLYTGC